MPLRGSVRFLLPSLRMGLARKAAICVSATAVLVFGAAVVRDAFPAIERDGLAQTLRQSVWAEALSGQSTPVRWPWEDLTVSMSLDPSANVPRLGLSAAMQIEAPPVRTTDAKRARADRNKTAEHAGDVALRDVEIGSNITFTAADGATCIYRVTGRPVVDPHLTAGEAGRTLGEAAMGEAALFECGKLENLIMQATQAAPKPSPSGAQHDL